MSKWPSEGYCLTKCFQRFWLHQFQDLTFPSFTWVETVDINTIQQTVFMKFNLKWFSTLQNTSSNCGALCFYYPKSIRILIKCIDEKYFTYKLKIISQDHHRIGSGTASPMSPGNEETEHRSTSVSAFSIQTENTEENCKFCSHMYFSF